MINETAVALLSFYLFILLAVIGGLALSVRALIRGEWFNAAAGTLLSLAIGALAAVPVML